MRGKQRDAHCAIFYDILRNDVLLLSFILINIAVHTDGPLNSR